jgi:hypothetical protein
VSTRTSQLQIRVTPGEKETLKRLAGAAGQSVSTYVLSHALPSSERDFARALDDLRGPAPRREALAALEALVSGLTAADFGTSLAQARVADLPAASQNYVAGVVEDAAAALDLEPPPWVHRVYPLERPHFRWPLQSLKPHQLKATRVALKRRNIFDPTSAGPSGRRPVSPRLNALATKLNSLELDVEFYFIGGALLHQAFAARPASVHAKFLFRPTRDALAAVRELGEQSGWPATWLTDELRQQTGQAGPGHRFLDVPNLRAYALHPEYVLAIKAAALPADYGAEEVDDLRFVMRSLNLPSPDAALSVVVRYFGERQLPPHLREAPEGRLPA